jgi:hypothetical protein
MFIYRINVSKGTAIRHFQKSHGAAVAVHIGIELVAIGNIKDVKSPLLLQPAPTVKSHYTAAGMSPLKSDFVVRRGGFVTQPLTQAMPAHSHSFEEAALEKPIFPLAEGIMAATMVHARRIALLLVMSPVW